MFFEAFHPPFQVSGRLTSALPSEPGCSRTTLPEGQPLSRSHRAGPNLQRKPRFQQTPRSRQQEKTKPGQPKNPPKTPQTGLGAPATTAGGIFGNWPPRPQPPLPTVTLGGGQRARFSFYSTQGKLGAGVSGAGRGVSLRQEHVWPQGTRGRGRQR